MAMLRDQRLYDPQPATRLTAINLVEEGSS